MEQLSDWPRRLSKRIGEAVEAARKARGVSAVELSDRCAAIGHPIHRTTLSKIEKGRSSFDLAELLTLAAALEVPPIVLLYPGLPDGEVEALPGVVADSWTAAQWFAGRIDVQRVSGRMVRTVSAAGTTSVDLLTAIDRRDQIDAEEAKQAARAGDWADEDVQRVVKQIIADAENERARLTARIVELGGTVSDA